MTEFDLLQGKIISLVIWNTEKENDVRVCLGEIIKKDGIFSFINPTEKWNVTLTSEMLSRLKEVPQELKKVLGNADFSISLSLGNLPGNSTEGFDPTGLVWD